MSSTLLQLVQQATGEMGLNQPTQVVGNSSSDVIQLYSLINSVGYEVQRDHNWEALDKEYRFYTVYTTLTCTLVEDSVNVTTLESTTGLSNLYIVTGTGINQDTYVNTVTGANSLTLSQAATQTGVFTLYFSQAKYPLPSDWDRQVDRTHYDKSKRWEMLGPTDAQQWQFLKSSYISTGPRIRYRILGGYFQIWPAMNTDEYLGFEYMSNQWATSSTGVTQSSFLADSDTCIFPDRLMVTALKKKYFEIKGFDSTAFTRDYLQQLSFAKANDSGSATLSFAPTPGAILIGFENIPDANYGQ
ncbi:hypothetical protein UFOVP770_14 [uncultured Caudovirales phage]|uniref:Uncharacterized protein n=1 Tax=uncultured Caudovirales phage TaxID=2100421 RepID=A0A6J5NU59_9CAUD|nr:hypothetical protein UFOVP770_14 [uncultured Caudovirales phage]